MKSFGNRDLIVRISADTAGMRSAIAQANKSLMEFGKTAQDVSNYVNSWSAKLAKWGLVIHGLKQSWEVLNAGIAIFAEMGNSLKSVSDRTGIAVSNLSALKYAADQSGTSFETMVDSLKTFQSQLGAVQLGDQGSIKKFETAGINVSEYLGVDAENQFKMLADHIASIPDKAEQAQVAIQLFGNAGYELLPMFQKGSAGIDALCEKAKELGYVMGDEDAENAKKMTQSINGLKNSLTGLVREGIASIAKPMTDGINYMKGWVEWGVKFVGQHKTMINILLQTIKILAIFKFALLCGGAWQFVLDNLKSIQLAALACGKSISGINVALKGMITTNPIGWTLVLAAGIKMLADAFLKTKNALDNLTNAYDEFQTREGEFAKETDAYNQKIERLQELCSQEQLTNAERKETARLVEQLNKLYGENILQIDKATGKVTNLAKAQEALNDTMKKKRIESLQKYIQEEKQNLQNYDKRYEQLDKRWTNYVDTDWSLLDYMGGGKERDQKEMREIKSEQSQRKKRIADAEAELQSLQSNTNPSKTEKEQDAQILAEREKKKTEAAEKAKAESEVVSGSQSLSSSVQAMKKAQEEKGLNEYQKKMKAIQEQLEKIQETAQKGGMTDELTNAQNQLYEDLRLLEEMEEEYEKNEAAAKAAKAAAEAKAKAEQERQQSLQRIRDLTKQLEDASLSSSQKELKALKDINEELKKRLETTQGLTAEEKAAAQKALADNEKRQNEFVQNRLDPAQAQYNLEMDHLQENLAREREEYLQALEKAKYDESNKDVQTAKKEMEQAEDAIRQQTLTGAQKEQEKAQEEYTEKLSNLNNALTDEDRLKATDEMEAARERLKNATERVYSLKNDAAQKKILEAGKKEQKEMAQMESRGTFSAYGLDSMVSSIPQQQLDYTKRIAMFVQSIFQGQQAEGVTV